MTAAGLADMGGSGSQKRNGWRKPLLCLTGTNITGPRVPAQGVAVGIADGQTAR